MARSASPLSGSVFSAASFETEASSVESSPNYEYVKLKLEESKAVFVEALVDSAVLIIEAIWPHAAASCTRASQRNMPLRQFIQETLKRSRASYSTFQVCLYYLILIKPVVYRLRYLTEMSGAVRWSRKDEQDDETATSKPFMSLLTCGRRSFLTSLMLASKYLQDRNYSVCAWSRISGLGTKELKSNEISFLKAVKWNLHISPDVYSRWSRLLLMSVSDSPLAWMQKIIGIGPDMLESSMTSKLCTTNRNDTSESLCPWEFIELSPEPQQPPFYLSPSPSPANETSRPAVSTSRKKKGSPNDDNDSDDIIILREHRSVVNLDAMTATKAKPAVSVVELINCDTPAAELIDVDEPKPRPVKRARVSHPGVSAYTGSAYADSSSPSKVVIVVD